MAECLCLLRCTNPLSFGIQYIPGRISLAGDVDKASTEENVLRATKRTRNSKEEQSLLTVRSGAVQHRKKIMGDSQCLSIKYDLSGRRLLGLKNVGYSSRLKVNEKIELLCQDSGLRGWWFRSTTLGISQKKTEVQYDDVEDQEAGGNLVVWC
ncbi:hypothetical protein Ancab_004559 [Ancistrocladus abbreviatus]